MAKVEKEVTDMVLEKINELGIEYKNNSCNNENYNSYNDNYYLNKYNEVFAKALELLLLKVDNIEQKMSQLNLE